MKRKQKKPRSIECLIAIFHCKSVMMRHRAVRRPKDRRKILQQEE